MDAINNAGLVDTPYPVQDTLFFKIQGDQTSIKKTSEVIQSIVKRHGSMQFKFAATDQEAEDLWQNRKYALSSSLAANPGLHCWTTDVWLAFILLNNCWC
jgi:D-lactate dehydrogenase (cytochrome)